MLSKSATENPVPTKIGKKLPNVYALAREGNSVTDIAESLDVPASQVESELRLVAAPILNLE